VIFTEDMENIFGPRKPKDGEEPAAALPEAGEQPAEA
jgi:hypothetical protein